MQGEGTSRMSRIPRTTASCRTIEAHTGTHIFEIDDYSQKKGSTDVGRFIRSSTFTVGGFDWCIRFYPNSNDVDTKVEVRAHCNIQFIGGDDVMKDSNISWYPTGTRLFKSKGEYKPRHMGFLLRSSLEDQFVQNNHLTIQCDLTVIQVWYTLSENRELPVTEIPVPQSDIKVQFGKLLEDKKGADVTFAVAGQTFDAHKAILAARSPVFMEQLYDGSTTREVQAGPVTVENMNPVAFRALLQFIYTDTMPADVLFDPQGVDYGAMIINLLVAANRYAMVRLKLLCEGILAEKLNMEAVGTSADLAQKEACTEFMASLCERDVIQACALLKRSCPSFVTAVFERRNGNE